MLLITVSLIACSSNRALIGDPSNQRKNIETDIQATERIDDQALSLNIHPMVDGIEKINLVIDAVENYYGDNGRYPEKIEELIPKYLDEKPVTLTGEEIWYEKEEKDQYLVGYNPTETRYCIYKKEIGDIECGRYSER